MTQQSLPSVYDASFFTRLAAALGALAARFEKAPRALRVLVVGAHCDDESLGFSNALSSLQRLGGQILVAIFAAADRDRAQESVEAMRRVGIDRSQVLTFDFPDTALRREYATVSRTLRALKEAFHFDLSAQHRSDHHCDHVALHHACREVFADDVPSQFLFRIPQRTPKVFEPRVWLRMKGSPLAPDSDFERSSFALEAYQTERERTDYFNPHIRLGFHIEHGRYAGAESAEPYECRSIAFAPCDCGQSWALKRNAARGDMTLSQEGVRQVRCRDARIILEAARCGCPTLALGAPSA